MSRKPWCTRWRQQSQKRHHAVNYSISTIFYRSCIQFFHLPFKSYFLHANHVPTFGPFSLLTHLPIQISVPLKSPSYIYSAPWCFLLYKAPVTLETWRLLECNIMSVLEINILMRPYCYYAQPISSEPNSNRGSSSVLPLTDAIHITGGSHSPVWSVSATENSAHFYVSNSKLTEMRKSYYIYKFDFRDSISILQSHLSLCASDHFKAGIN
jgi:hypothetical protein